MRAIGRCAVILERAAEKCINVLLELIQTKVNYVVQEAIIVIKVGVFACVLAHKKSCWLANWRLANLLLPCLCTSVLILEPFIGLSGKASWSLVIRQAAIFKA